MKFSNITGHSELKKHLARSVDEGRVSHAQLFVGTSGSGALPLALAYAQYVNCTARTHGDSHGNSYGDSHGDSCGECPSCRKIALLAHPDLHFVFPVNSASKSGSSKPTSDAFLPQWRELWSATDGLFDEQMWYGALAMENQQGLITRAEADEIVRKLSFKSFEAQYKVVIIWLPEKMRAEAANTLLKILEEPWERTLFLLVSASPEQLLPTILSRTQQIAVPAVSDADVAGKYGEEITRLAAGDLIRARVLASEGSGASTSASDEENFELFASLMRLSYNDKHVELLEWAETVAATGREEQKRLLQYGIRLLRETYMLSAGMDEITNLWGGEREFCARFSPFIGNHNIERLVAEMELALLHITRNGNPKIVFAHFALVVSKLIVK